MWKKFNEDNPPEHDKFLVVISGYKKPMIKMVEKVNFWGSIAYSFESGERSYPERMLWWTELPEFKEEYK